MHQDVHYLQGVLPDLIYGGCTATLFITWKNNEAPLSSLLDL